MFTCFHSLLELSQNMPTTDAVLSPQLSSFLHTTPSASSVLNGTLSLCLFAHALCPPSLTHPTYVCAHVPGASLAYTPYDLYRCLPSTCIVYFPTCWIQSYDPLRPFLPPGAGRYPVALSETHTGPESTIQYFNMAQDTRLQIFLCPESRSDGMHRLCPSHSFQPRSSPLQLLARCVDRKHTRVLPQ